MDASSINRKIFSPSVQSVMAVRRMPQFRGWVVFTTCVLPFDQLAACLEGLISRDASRLNAHWLYECLKQVLFDRNTCNQGKRSQSFPFIVVGFQPQSCLRWLRPKVPSDTWRVCFIEVYESTQPATSALKKKINANPSTEFNFKFWMNPSN